MNMKDRLTRFLKTFSRNNKGAKIIALVLAVITWYAIQPSISFETIVSDVPVRVMVDPGWAVLEQSVASVDVHFRGSREGIRYLVHEQLEVLVDIRGMPYEESITVPLELRNVRAPAGVRPAFVRPSEVVLSVDQEEDREVPVRVHIQGSPPEGYEVEAMTATPSVVTVSGPRQRLDTIDAIRTTPIDLEGRLQSFKLRVGLVSPGRAWTARIEPERVEVEVTLIERAARATFDEVRIKKLLGARRWDTVEIEPAYADIQLVGRSELLDGLAPKDVRAYVDLSGLEPGTPYELPVRVHVPARIRVDRVVPEKVNVVVHNEETETQGAGNR